jgi:hypothetical protein
MVAEQFKTGITARFSQQSLVTLLARFGYGARGIVYILVGGLAVLAALGPWGTTTDSRGALRIVLDQPLGWIWIGFIGVGLGLFALWRLAQSILDADGLGTSLTMLGRRAAYLISAIGNAGLATFAVNLAVGLAVHGSGESSAKSWVAWIMKLSYGTWAVMVLGLGLVTAGMVMLWQAWDVDRIVEFLDCPPGHSWWMVPAGRLGFAARGIVFGLIGGFLVFAGYQGRSGEARGLDGALESLAAQPNGWMLLAATAAGLMAFGLFGIVQALYRHIRPPRLDDVTGIAQLSSSAARSGR